MQPWALAFAIASMLLSGSFLLRRVVAGVALAPSLLLLLLALHGPAYLWYTRVWGPHQPFFNRIVWAAGPGIDPITRLDIAIGITFSGACIGIALADRVLGCGPRQMQAAMASWRHDMVRPPEQAARRAMALGAILSAYLVVVISTDDHLSRILTYVQSRGDEFDKIALRRSLCAGDSYTYLLLKATVIPFSACALLVLARSGGHVAWWSFGTLVPCLLVANLATLSKSPVVVLCLLLLLAEIVRRDLQPRWKSLATASIVGGGLLVTTTLVSIRSLEGPLEAMRFLMYRVFMVGNEVLLEYFAAVPNRIPHAWGMGSRWISALTGRDPQPQLHWLVGEVHRNVRASTSNAMFVGDAWGNFGWLGVVIAPVIMGFLARGLDIELILRRGKSVGTVAGLVLGLHGLFIALSNALQTALLTGGLLMVVPLAAWLGTGRRRRIEVADSMHSLQTAGNAPLPGLRDGPTLPSQT
jgi:hypothetical protein